MFLFMLEALQRGELPDRSMLQARFRAALVKKLGVLRQPYLVRPGDPKINPHTAHLLWAAILLGDREGCAMVEGVLEAEAAERRPPGRQAAGEAEAGREAREALVRELLDVAALPLRDAIASLVRAVGYDHVVREQEERSAGRR